MAQVHPWVPRVGVENGDDSLDHNGLPRALSKSYSNPPIFNYFDKKDPNSSMHVMHDTCSSKTLAHITKPEKRFNQSSMEALDDEVCKVARRLRMLALEQRKMSKRSAQSAQAFPEYHESLFQQMLIPVFLVTMFIGILVICTLWNHSGGLHHSLGAAHVHHLRTRSGFLKSPMYTATRSTSIIQLTGDKADVFDIRLMVMSTAAQTLAQNSTSPHNASQKASNAPEAGSLHYKLLADGEDVHTNEVKLLGQEREFFETVNVADKLGGKKAQHFELEVWADTVDDQPVAFLCQVLQMGALAKHRFIIGVLVFVITFGFIISEVIHRVYSAFVGTIVMHAIMALIQETPQLQDIATMIDFGTLMVLFFNDDHDAHAVTDWLLRVVHDSDCGFFQTRPSLLVLLVEYLCRFSQRFP